MPQSAGCEVGAGGVLALGRALGSAGDGVALAGGAAAAGEAVVAVAAAGPGVTTGAGAHAARTARLTNTALTRTSVRETPPKGCVKRP
jgi:hypothetical protein